ncbi:MAG: VWA domain-containing protein [Gammaproteobacteria bacterium]|nr:VWA domain-containing protein [Gammaproteobacteria bacterium]
MPETGDSRIAENIVRFCRTLRHAGLPVGPGQVIDACRAIARTGIGRRDDFRTALKAVLVNDPAHFAVFEQAFHVYFRNPRLLERMMGLLLPTLERESPDAPGDEAIRRLLEALAEPVARDDDSVVVEIDRTASYSRHELLRHKDFEAMTLAELAEAKRLLREGTDFLRRMPTRRFRTDSVGGRYDLRRTIRLMLRTNGQIIQLARKRRRKEFPTLVLICDISGSMSRYSRMFLHFAHALSASGRDVHSFVFGTRLTNITHWLVDKDVDRALHRVSVEVQDWDGGTRIADCLARFNEDWGRRVLARRSVVVLLSDGLERDSASDLDFQAARLRRSAGELIWLNPMLRFQDFEPLAYGIRTILPHVDDFLPAHNVESLTGLGRLLADRNPERYRNTA